MSYALWRRVHKWLGLVLGLQLILWTMSGFVMSLLDHDLVDGSRDRTSAAVPQHSLPDGLMEPRLIASVIAGEIETIELTWLDERAVYRVRQGEQTRVLDACSGKPIGVDAILAQSIAAADYRGPGTALSPDRIVAPVLEVRKHRGEVWRVPFADDRDTALYVDAADGRILERRNDAWRPYDFFWMLHTLDYVGRDDFNNGWVVAAAASVFWLALTGVLMLACDLSRGQYLFWHRKAAARAAK